MFDRIARRYDLMNRLLSLGVDRRWRRRTVRALNLPAKPKVLDLATGTADVALEVLRQRPEAQVVGVDPSAGMLDIGRRKVDRIGGVDRIELRQGSAESLPFADGSFDAVTIAFGIRNVPDRPAALAEMARVVVPGGRVAILELSEPRGRILGPLARFHIHTLVPTLGAWASGAREYAYLEQSIARFPAPQDFAQQMEACGLTPLSVTPLTFGACCLFVGSPSEARS